MEDLGTDKVMKSLKEFHLMEAEVESKEESLRKVTNVFREKEEKLEKVKLFCNRSPFFGMIP